MSEFLDVIEWFDETGLEIAHRIPEGGSAETKLGSQLVVREHQAAIFFRDGKGLDVFGPGRHTLSTMNLPLLTKLLSLPWGFQSPFRCETYFVSLKVFTNMRWGTKDPVAFKDERFGLIRLRAFGSFTMQITQPLLFINTLVGSQGSFATDHIEDYLREVIVSRLNDFLGETLRSLLDLPAIYDEMAVAVRARLVDDFRKFGIEFTDFFVNRITPPEEVQKMIDERSGMAAVGDMDTFLKFKAAKAMGDAAQGGGGLGGEAASGMGLGVGAGLGMMLPGMLFKTVHAAPATAAAIAEGGVVDCEDCHGEVPIGSRFCSHCGVQLVIIRKCPECSANVDENARFCAQCGVNLGARRACTACGAKLPAGTKFCMGCGEKVGE